MTGPCRKNTAWVSEESELGHTGQIHSRLTRAKFQRLNSGFRKQSRKIRPGNCKREHQPGCHRPPPRSPEAGGPPPPPRWLPPPSCPSRPPLAHLTGCSSPQRRFAVPSTSSGATVLKCVGAQESLKSIQKKKVHLYSEEQSGVPA